KSPLNQTTMITIKNYLDKKDTIDWASMPKKILNTRKDVEEIMEFYDDDADIKDTVDLFLKGINDSLESKKPPTGSTSPLVIYKEGEFLTKRSFTSEFSFIENENLAYTWAESERSSAQKIAKGYDALLITMKEALKIRELKKASQINREKTYPSKNENFDLIVTNAGGVSVVSNKKKEVNQDYETIAHINSKGDIKYFRQNLPKEVIDFCEKHASNQKPTSYEKQISEVRNVMLYAKFKDQKSYKAVGAGKQVDNLLYATIFPIENLEKLKNSIEPNPDVDYQIRVAGSAKVLWDSNENTKTEKKLPGAKKVEKVVNKTIVDNLSTEFLLIRRFWNIIKKETVSVPFRTVQLLYMAFNKAAVERKVRKSSEAAELFTQCNKKIITLFEDIPNSDKKPYTIEFTDKALYGKIQNYVTDVAVNPAIPVLKRFIAIQNTKPEIKKVEDLLKSISKVYENAKDNRLSPELFKAKKELEDYLAKPTETIEPTFYGLSVPLVCTNRVKCAGISKQGRLLKGYKFEEHTGNVVKVRKAVTKKKAVKKKVAAGLGLVFNDQVETIYVDNFPVIPIVARKNTIIEELEEPELNKSEEKQSNSVNLPVNRNSLAYRKQKNKNKSHEYYKIDNDDISKFLGQIEKKKKESVAITIAGGQGSGKTSFVFQLINAFAKNYKVGHASIEEHPESALYENKADRFWDDNAKATVDSPEINSLNDIHELINRNDVIIIDSFSKLLSWNNRITLDETFRKKYDGKLFVIIYQLTTDGKMRGGSSSQFDGDVILFVEKFPNFSENYVYADKNRYQNQSLEDLHYNIAGARLDQPQLFTEEVERI
ncbi:hypothetical protein DNC80_15660, partial [Flavobacterium sp. SOK18b]|uniref:hypothetical protein n=1 Tax=Flavobacterium sp. SOK18b TaxID=797900 RepID=UPI001C71C06E